MVVLVVLVRFSSNDLNTRLLCPLWRSFSNIENLKTENFSWVHKCCPKSSPFEDWTKFFHLNAKLILYLDPHSFTIVGIHSLFVSSDPNYTLINQKVSMVAGDILKYVILTGWIAVRNQSKGTFINDVTNVTLFSGSSLT